MLIPHEFVEDGHYYKVPGRYVICLSDIISLNGLSNNEQVPLERLLQASLRGTNFDKEVQAFEENKKLPPMPEDVRQCFVGYLNFRKDHEVKLAWKMQNSMVWEHNGSDILVGGTPDLCLFIDDELWNVDCKTTFPLCGKAKRMKELAWRIQLQGQLDAWNENEDLWTTLGESQVMKKAILHCHPKLKNGYSFIPFPQDDSYLFDSALRMAVAKLAAGFEVKRR
jgi:hypothetical protein